jgi:acylpyruvate hydrolase
MRLATIRTGSGTEAVRVEGDGAVGLGYPDLGALLASGSDWAERAAQGDGEAVELGNAAYVPPVLRPEKIFLIGLNYRAHAEEARLPVPDDPPVFSMFWRALIGAHDDLVLPRNSDMVDWEAELGVVIGAELRHASEDEARVGIAGYTIVNDVSMRDWQRRTSQFLQGKTFERSSPAGPFVVTPDEVDHARRLHVTCTVDGEPMQDAYTDDLIFKPIPVVSYLSQILTLVPGDMVAMGTPGGVGGARDPQIYLRDGQVMRTAIEGLGEQINRCVDERAE